MKPWNAATRLHSILENARAQKADQPGRAAWASVLGLDPNNGREVMKNVLLLGDVLEEIEKSIRENPGRPTDLYLRNFDRLRRALSITNLDGSWGTQAQLLTEAAVGDLAFCSEAIQARQPEFEAPLDSIRMLAAEIEELTTLVAESDIDPELRTVILVCLEALRRAVAEYRIRGASALRDAVKNSLAELLLVADVVKSEHQKTPVVKFLSLLAMADQVVTKVWKYKALLATPIRGLLPEFASAIDNLPNLGGGD